MMKSNCKFTISFSTISQMTFQTPILPDSQLLTSNVIATHGEAW